MKFHRSVVPLIVSLCLIPTLASAQSYWLHKQIMRAGTYASQAQLLAADSTDCILIWGMPDFQLRSTDYWKTSRYIMVDSPKYPIRNYTMTSVVRPSRELLLVACNDRKVGHVIRSTDGGSTWKDTTIGSYVKGQPGNFVAAIAIRDSNHVAMLVDDTMSYFANLAFFSSDAGRTWQSTSVPLFHHTDTYDFAPYPAMAYPAANTLIVAAKNTFGSNSTLYRSTNLGITWDTVYRPNTTVTKLAFVDSQIGFASGCWNDLDAKTYTATIDKTTDGGATWTNVLRKMITPASAAFANSTASLLSIAFADSLHGLACGNEGLILQTNDGGTTWNELPSDFTADAIQNDVLSDVVYPDTAHAIIASGDGAVLLYHPEGILSLPTITYPHFTPYIVPRTFDITWDPVPGATRYSLLIETSGLPDSTTAIYVRDTNITTTSYHITNAPDTSPSDPNRRYTIYLKAYSSTNESNTAKRLFYVVHGTSGVEQQSSEASLDVYPDPATNYVKVEGYSGPIAIIDAAGHTKQGEVFNGRLDVSSLPAGVYYLNSNTILNGKHRVSRFLKK